MSTTKTEKKAAAPAKKAPAAKKETKPKAVKKTTTVKKEVKKPAATKSSATAKKEVKKVATKKKVVGAVVKVQQIGSPIAKFKAQKLSLKGLGLGKINHIVEVEDTPSVRGMINKVKHLVKVI